MTRWIYLAFLFPIGGLSVAAVDQYVGQWPVYVLFTLLANALLLNGFRRDALFFDTFIGIFFWLGFWLKLTLRVAFTGGEFHEPVGAFDASAGAFDRALLISACGMAAVLAASWIRELIFAYPERAQPWSDSALFHFYRKYRVRLFVAFVLTVLLVGVSNLGLGIYQRGMVAQTVLPFGLNGVYKWLLQFGLSSLAALIVRFELELAKTITPLAVAAPLLETFISNVSLLSRGMVLNASALGFGGLRQMAALRQRLAARALVPAVLAFVILFAVSVQAVNYLRVLTTLEDDSTATATATAMAKPLFIDRWVGIEGVMAVSSAEGLGWNLWRQAWEERYQEGVLGLYDTRFIESPYTHPSIDRTRNHYVSLPGIVAFLYYPGSATFLFLALFIGALAASALEWAAWRWCGRNLVLCALFGQVIAFRFASFGYVPAQSYLLFGALFLNGLLIFAADRACSRAFGLPKASISNTPPVPQ